MQWLSGSPAPAKTPAGQNNNALLNSWELQPVWKVELCGCYKCWRAFNPDGHSCLRPQPGAELPRGNRKGDGVKKKAKPSHPDNSWTHRPHTESAPPPLHLHEHPMSHKCMTCTWISTFTLLRKLADSVIYITICLRGHTCERVWIQNVCWKTSPAPQSSPVQPGQQVMMQCLLNRVFFCWIAKHAYLSKWNLHHW